MNTDNIYLLLENIEIKSLPEIEDKNEINLFGEDSNNSGIEKLIIDKSKSISELSNYNNSIFTLIVVVLSVFWIFPEKVSFHPKLEAIVKSDYFGYVWIISLLVVVVFWIIYYVKKINNEKRKNEVSKLKSMLKLNKIQNQIFSGFYLSLSNTKPPKTIFGQQEFTDYLLNFININNEYTPDIDEISNYILDKAKSKNILSQIENKEGISLDTFFKFNQ
ncbi:MAG: hypothetical protein DHS20C18_13060 [Saprospiraceae bacterium]|nr:MAG: hypothetical protein DHS20C18_13060 [Saprospiraceae bacterium]